MLEVKPERGLLSWLFVPSPSYSLALGLVAMGNGAFGATYTICFLFSLSFVQIQLVYALIIASAFESHPQTKGTTRGTNGHQRAMSMGQDHGTSDK
jgi:hypothetical protein